MYRKIVSLWAVAFVAALLLSSCSARWACKKCKAFGQTDTTRQVIRVEIPGVAADTVFYSIIPPTLHDTVVQVRPDTLYLTKDRLRVKVVVRDSTVYVQGECLPEIVYKEIPCGETISVGFSNLQYFGSLIGVALFFIALLVWSLSRKR